MARELTWHERRAVNLQLQRRDGQRSRPNPSTGVAAAAVRQPEVHTASQVDALTAPSDEPPTHDDFPQPLKGFDYAFGAVG